jgi:hypothetical protein
MTPVSSDQFHSQLKEFIGDLVLSEDVRNVSEKYGIDSDLMEDFLEDLYNETEESSDQKLDYREVGKKYDVSPRSLLLIRLEAEVSRLVRIVRGSCSDGDIYSSALEVAKWASLLANVREYDDHRSTDSCSDHDGAGDC